MKLEGIKIGLVFTGAFYMIESTIPKIKDLVNEHAIVIPIMSYNAYNSIILKERNLIAKIEDLTQKKIIHTINEIEPIGRKNMTDIMLVAPCTRKYYL